MLRGGGAIARRGLNGPVGGYGRLRCGFSVNYEFAMASQLLMKPQRTSKARTKRDCASAGQAAPRRPERKRGYAVRETKQIKQTTTSAINSKTPLSAAKHPV